jgi:hypothetical protein
MALSSDFSALIAIAQAHELDGIKKQILDRNEELGAVAAFELLKELATRRKALAEERRRATVDPDFGFPEGDEATDGR